MATKLGITELMTKVYRFNKKSPIKVEVILLFDPKEKDVYFIPRSSLGQKNEILWRSKIKTFEEVLPKRLKGKLNEQKKKWIEKELSRILGCIIIIHEKEKNE